MFIGVDTPGMKPNKSGKYRIIFTADYVIKLTK